MRIIDTMRAVKMLSHLRGSSSLTSTVRTFEGKPIDMLSLHMHLTKKQRWSIIGNKSNYESIFKEIINTSISWMPFLIIAHSEQVSHIASLFIRIKSSVIMLTWTEVVLIDTCNNVNTLKYLPSPSSMEVIHRHTLVSRTHCRTIKAGRR